MAQVNMKGMVMLVIIGTGHDDQTGVFDDLVDQTGVGGFSPLNPCRWGRSHRDWRRT